MSSADEERAPPARDGNAGSEPNGRALTVVGIGASAGGLEALGAMLNNLELDGSALVVVQHLAPDHDSLLGELLSRVTTTKVVTITDGMALEANRIYVIPPACDLAVLHGVLHLIPTARGSHLAIDFFLRSLAADRGSSAIGVVLSGAGTDGTLGLQAIKAEGGITFVQDPSTARYDGMPRSALESGYADFCLSPEGIAQELTRIARHPYLARAAAAGASPLQDHLSKIFILIRKEFGNDFTYYKHSTIERRIERRMALHKIDSLPDYVRYLQGHPPELATLYKDMLINVTSFFRDRGPFDYLKTTLFPRMLEQKKPGDKIRIWTAGCATGEETYSVAISLLEVLGDSAGNFKIQLFGTDIDSSSIRAARRGVYPHNIALDVTPERLQRFFRRHDREYQVSRAVRDTVVFATQNLTKDAPFSHLDLVSCRNVLIYLQPVLQKKVLRILHYALEPGGRLMLGTSETIGDSPDLFALQDRQNKIYSKKNITSVAAFDVGADGHPRDPMTPSSPPPLEPRAMTSVHQLADRKLLDRYAPPGVLLNENLEILQFRGRTAPYLEPAPGLASLQILKHIHPELHAELRAALDQSRAEGVSISREPVTLRDRDSGVVRNVAIEVLPLVDSTNRSGCLLVLFKEDRPFTRAAADPRPEPSADMPGDNITRDIERELQSTKEYLQTTIEELETANEELKSSNEELQSSNEELQSTNEELETAKEELQSSNEELTTVNDELQTRMSELSLSMDDLSNVLSGVEAAVVIVGIDLRVRRFSHAAEKLLDLTGPNLGRAVELIAARVKNIDIVSAIQEVIARAAAAQYDVAIGRRWYAMRISPYLSADHSIRGALLTFDPTPENGHSLDQALAAAEYAGTLLVAIRHALLIMDETTRVVWANGAFYRAFDLSPDQTLGRPMAELPNHPWTDPEVVERVRATLSSGVPFKDFEIEAAGASSGPARGQATARKKMRLGGNIIPNPPSQNGQPLILIVVETVDEDEPPPRA